MCKLESNCYEDRTQKDKMKCSYAKGIMVIFLQIKVYNKMRVLRLSLPWKILVCRKMKAWYLLLSLKIMVCKKIGYCTFHYHGRSWFLKNENIVSPIIIEDFGL
jgi:hypothetical protein